jgi:hypothetical protein
MARLKMDPRLRGDDGRSEFVLPWQNIQRELGFLGETDCVAN